MKKILILICLMLCVFASNTVFADAQHFVRHEFIQVDTVESSHNDRVYLSSAPSKTLYQYMYDEFYSGADIINISEYHVGAEEFFKTYDKVTYENPELFVNTWANISYSMNSDGEVQSFGAEYLELEDGIEEARVILEDGINEITDIAKVYSSDIDKALVAHDEIISRYEYYKLADGEDSYPVITTNAYSFFKYGMATCQAYSQIFNVVMRELGINTSYCSNSNHMWSMIEIGGKWYHADLTWDDPIVGDGSTNTYKAFHEYFLVSDDVMDDTHEDKSGWKYTDAHDADDKYYETDTIFSKFGGFPCIFLPDNNGLYKFSVPYAPYGVSQNIESGIKLNNIIHTEVYNLNSAEGVFNIKLCGLEDYTSEQFMVLSAYYDDGGKLIKCEIKDVGSVKNNSFAQYKISLNKTLMDDGCKAVLYMWDGAAALSPYSLITEIKY